MNHERMKSNRAIRQAYGIFKSENIHITQEMLETQINLYNKKEKTKPIVLILRKETDNGRKRNV